jgi:ribosomal protein S27AE
MDGTPNVVHIERVRCLECGTTYTKPGDGGTVNENPGCPRCGYLGWIAASVPDAPASPSRFDGGRPLRPAAQPH